MGGTHYPAIIHVKYYHHESESEVILTFMFNLPQQGGSLEVDSLQLQAWIFWFRGNVN
jgi:hypothetical protein